MVWPFTPWGAGSSPSNPREPTMAEYDACMNSPGATHGRVRGNILTGYRLEPTTQGSDYEQGR
jgi:hypothetical protein